MAENPVMPEPIEQMLSKIADVPVIISYTAHEYIMFLRGESSRIFLNKSILSLRIIHYVSVFHRQKSKYIKRSERLSAHVREQFEDVEEVGGRGYRAIVRNLDQ